MSKWPERPIGAPIPTDEVAGKQLAFPGVTQSGRLAAEARPSPRTAGHGLERLGLALDQGALGALSGRQMAINRLRGIWEDLVGPRMAERTDPIEVQNRALLVRADNSHWARSLRLLRATLLHRIQQQPGCARIMDLKVRIAPPRRKAVTPAPTRPPSEQHRRNAEELVQGLHHPELRAQLTDILPGMLARTSREEEG